MSKDKRGSAGGKARAILQKQEAKQRIDDYNKNPNLCLFCNKPILASYNQKLYHTKIKKFCSLSCSTKFNNLDKIRNPSGNGFNHSSIIDNFSDDEILEAFNNSNSISEFSKKLGYKSKLHYTNSVVNKRLEKFGLSLNNLRKENIDVSSETKGGLLNRCSMWQTARSIIAKNDRKIYSQSNKPKKCICCGYDKHYEVAHIKAVSDFDDNALISQINDLNNLIALCPNHHWEYDNTDFDITPFLNEVS